MDDDSGLIYPGSTFSGIHVEGGRDERPSRDGEVELRFTSADAPDLVARWYRDPARAADFTVASAGREGAGLRHRRHQPATTTAASAPPRPARRAAAPTARVLLDRPRIDGRAARRPRGGARPSRRRGARPGVALSYGELLEHLGYRFSRPKMRALCAMLGEIDREAEARGEPELAVLVVRAERRHSRPGLVGRRRRARRAAMRGPGRGPRRRASSPRCRRKPSPSGSPGMGQSAAKAPR